jgi:HAD superfamily hydrolase (TIGR01509 family)
VAPELVIFDCDGVLVDSEPIANEILAESLTAIGLPTSAGQAVARFAGRSMAAIAGLAEADLGRPLPASFIDDVQRRTFAAFRARLKAVPGVAEALARIPVPVCVASSGAPEKIALSLSVTGLARRFEGRLFSASQVARGKPHPDLFLLAARAMGAAPARTAVIEDSVPGIAAARAAGMRALGFLGAGHATADLGRRLAAAGAETYSDMADLPALLGCA